MSTSTHSYQAPSLGSIGKWPAATVLLATDGDERSDGAVRVAAARAATTGARLEVISVVRNEPVVSPEGMYIDAGIAPTWRTDRCVAVEAQLTRVLGTTERIAISVVEGNPSYTISRIAIERRAVLIVAGLGRHDLASRVFGEETALQLARLSRVPVLAVPAGVTGSPNHAVVAVDFSDLSVRAAQGGRRGGCGRRQSGARPRRLGSA